MIENLEIWRPTGLGDIEVSNMGSVRGAIAYHHQGYIDITKDMKTYPVHRLVAKAFPEICGDWFEDCDVHHINGNKSDNRAENLVVLTKSEHMIFHNKGENHPMYGKHPSEETLRKLSIARRRENLTEETLRKMSESTKGEKNPMFGKHHTEEALRRMSIAHRKENLSEKTIKKMRDSRPNKKTVYQYSLDGKFIASYKSTREAARILGCSHTAINYVCRGRNKSAKGFRWSYTPPKEQ